MDDSLGTGWQPAEVRFTNEIKNLTDRQVWTRAAERLKNSPNSTLNILREMPEGKIDRIVTSSVLTSDNVLAQSIIDMEMAPSLLLTPELREAWLSGLEKGELDGKLVNSEEWREQVNNSPIHIYQTGRFDSHHIEKGGRVYGKLHAKFLAGPRAGFVGTSNFDSRSRLINSEIGFFTVGEHPSVELNPEFEKLVRISYRWGTLEWLEMRRRLMSAGGSKGSFARGQRMIYTLIKALHLEWMI